MLGGGKGSGGGEEEGPGVYRGPESRVVEVERDVGEGCPFKELQACLHGGLIAETLCWPLRPGLPCW